MPTPPSPEPLSHVTVNLFTDDFEYLKLRYGKGAVGMVIRAAIRAHVLIVKGSFHQSIGAKPDVRRSRTI